MHVLINNYEKFTIKNTEIFIFGFDDTSNFNESFNKITHQGILMPDQGFFPKLTEGIHKDKNSTLIISRGLGNSGFPFRLFNHPEIVVVTLNNRTKFKKS